MSIRTYLTALVAMLTVANGHMVISTPVPFDVLTLDNSPLVADGSNFPCKSLTSNPPSTASGSPNYMEIGVDQTLSFKGSATHGGGSCQISLTTDKQPTKATKWEVIHSIIGACPAGVSGNLPANPDGSGASNFTYQIPSGIAPGDYVLAWTWFNKIGNREMYMNCAPITVAAGSGSKKRSPIPAPGPKTPGFSKRASSFPDMFVANIQGVSNGCATLESYDVVFPNPGDSVQSIQPGPFTAPVSCQGQAAVATGAASGGTGSSSAATSAAPAATSAASEGSSGSGTVAPGVFATGAASGTGVAATSVASSSATPSVVAPVASSAPSAAAPASSSTAPTTSGSGGAQSGACTNEGAWNCIDGSSFQRCASGAWSVAMDMAAGTKCTPGVSDTLTMEKRALRFSQPHVRRSHRAWGH